MSVILVYEDDLHLQELLVQVVRKEFTVCIGKNPQQIKEEINEVGPALILLDNMLEADVAKEVLACYRAETPSPIPVVLFTAHANGASIAEYIGADDYIAKPFKLLELRNKLKVLAKRE